LVSSGRARLETMAQKGSKKARKVLELLDEPEKILSTIQVGITLIGIVAGAYGGVALADDLAPIFHGSEYLKPWADSLAIVTAIALITYLSLVIGELVPKSLALSNPEKVALALSPTMIFLTRILLPFVWLLSVSTKAITRILGVKAITDKPITEDELRFMLNQGSEQGVLDKEETQMIRDVFRFGDKKATEIMTHRTEVSYLLNTITRTELTGLIQTEKHSKYLLCEGSPENIIGVVAVKDLIPLYENQGLLDLGSVASTPLFIPESIKAGRILQLFKEEKNNFGIVVNEYGSFEGIVTLHDLTEAILGDLPEEDEEAYASITVRADGSMLADGNMEIDDFMDRMGILSYEDIDNIGFTTLGGLAMYFLHKIPEEGDKFTYRELEFEIMDMDKSKVDKILISKISNV
ncbi:MAG: HlyC/CorC family transporter, partial [Lentimicrobium sp.]|nr:HlyC/CorC family transporter [Lentimicrobium sp.]